MRLSLHWRGRDVIDIDAHLWRKRDDDQPDRGPTLQAAAHLEDADRAEPAQPDTPVFGFGTRPESRT